MLSRAFMRDRTVGSQKRKRKYERLFSHPPRQFMFKQL